VHTHSLVRSGDKCTRTRCVRMLVMPRSRAKFTLLRVCALTLRAGGHHKRRHPLGVPACRARVLHRGGRHGRHHDPGARKDAISRGGRHARMQVSEGWREEGREGREGCRGGKGGGGEEEGGRQEIPATMAMTLLSLSHSLPLSLFLSRFSSLPLSLALPSPPSLPPSLLAGWLGVAGCGGGGRCKWSCSCKGFAPRTQTCSTCCTSR
jgi:hypothetical protein